MKWLSLQDALGEVRPNEVRVCGHVPSLYHAFDEVCPEEVSLTTKEFDQKQATVDRSRL